MADRVAIIDLGSNTFHLLITSCTGEGFSEIFRERIFVYLAKGGIETIRQDRFDAGLRALSHFKDICLQYDVSHIHAIGTSALRSAHNAGIFIEQARLETGIQIEVIDGLREAELIHKGSVHFLDLRDKPYLVMDIGGGSVEFIYNHGKEKPLYKSFDVGISQLRSKLTYSSPMTAAEHAHIMNIIEVETGGMDFLRDTPGAYYLIGASGPFEIFESLFGFDPDIKGQILDKADCLPWVDRIIYSTLQERVRIKGMPPERADLSLESMLLVDYVFSRITSLRKVCITPYALKEGYLLDKYF